MKKLIMISTFFCMFSTTSLLQSCSEEETIDGLEVIEADAWGALEGVLWTYENPYCPAWLAGGVTAYFAAEYSYGAGGHRYGNATNPWPGTFNDTVNFSLEMQDIFQEENPWELVGILHNELLNGMHTLGESPIEEDYENYADSILAQDRYGSIPSEYRLTSAISSCGGYFYRSIHYPSLMNEGATRGDLDNVLTEISTNYTAVFSLITYLETFVENNYSALHSNNKDARLSVLMSEITSVANSSLTDKDAILRFLTVYKYSTVYWFRYLNQ